MRHAVRCGAVFAVTLCVWWTGGLSLHRHVVDQNNELHLQELSEQLLRRAEKALDYVVIAKTNLLIDGHTTCAGTTSNALRQLVVDTGTVANLYLITPSEKCSSFDDLSLDLPTLSERQDWIEATNSAYRIGRLESRSKSLIGVSWGLDTDLELVAAINSDALLFDVLPNQLRSAGSVELLIDGQWNSPLKVVHQLG